MTSYRYDKTWVDIENMLVKAERKQDFHLTKIQEGVSKSDKIKHMRNYKALQGVIKALKWTLGDENINHPLE